MTITGVFGQIGSGKSWYQMKLGLRMANERHKRLVANFEIKPKELARYAQANGLPWVQWLAENNQIACIDAATRLEDLLIYPRSIVLLDEAGIFVNTRDFRNTPKELLQDLAQSRKDGVDLIYAAQFDEQCDRQFRDLTQFCVHAAGLAKHDKKLGGPRLHWKTYFEFTADNYNHWKANPRLRANPLTSARWALKTETGPFTKNDAALFGCFDSFARLEQQGSKARDMAATIPEDLSRTIRDTVRAGRRLRYFQRMKSDPQVLLSADLRDVRRYLRHGRKLVQNL